MYTNGLNDLHQFIYKTQLGITKANFVSFTHTDSANQKNFS